MKNMIAFIQTADNRIIATCALCGQTIDKEISPFPADIDLHDYIICDSCKETWKFLSELIKLWKNEILKKEKLK